MPFSTHGSDVARSGERRRRLGVVGALALAWLLLVLLGSLLAPWLPIADPERVYSLRSGQSIAGPGTVTLYEVGTLKDVVLDGGASRRYVSVDGGMSDNIRTALYDSAYDCRLASRRSAPPPVLSRVVGKHCESGDVVVRDCWLPEDLAPGDLLAVAATGAYCYSMASNYNRLPRPAVVAVRDGAARPMLRRETIEDLLRLEAEL